MNGCFFGGREGGQEKEVIQVTIAMRYVIDVYYPKQAPCQI